MSTSTFSGFTVSNSISGITTDSSHIYIINSPTGSALKNVLLSAYAIENNFAYSATINGNGFDLKSYAGSVLSTVNLAEISVNYATSAIKDSAGNTIRDYYASNGALTSLDASDITSGSLPIVRGGTGLSSASVNAILVGTATNSAN